MSVSTRRRQRRLERQALAHWLRELRGRTEARIEELGGFRGRIRPAQRPASWLLDRLERRRQELAEELAA
jgi:hypothetical protein